MTTALQDFKKWLTSNPTAGHDEIMNKVDSLMPKDRGSHMISMDEFMQKPDQSRDCFSQLYSTHPCKNYGDDAVREIYNQHHLEWVLYEAEQLKADEYKRNNP